MLPQFGHELLYTSPKDVDLGILEVLLEEGLDGSRVGFGGVTPFELDGDVLEAAALLAGGTASQGIPESVI